MADGPVSISLRTFKTTNKRGGRVRGWLWLFPLSTSDFRMQSRFIRQLSRENRETNFVRMEEKGGIFECLLVMPGSKPLKSHPPTIFSFEDKIYKELFKFLKRRTKQERENVRNFCRFSGKCWNKGIQEFWTSFKDARGLSSFILESFEIFRSALLRENTSVCYPCLGNAIFFLS